MKVDGKHFRSIWRERDGWSIGAIDQRRLPHEFVVAKLTSCEDAAAAIRDMLVRGAPLIGATAAYGMALAMREDASDAGLIRAYDTLVVARPTAINLKWALDEMRATLAPIDPLERAETAYARADEIVEQDVEINRGIAGNGLKLIEAIAAKKPGEVVNVLTHCNAGWLATVDWGTALAPVYFAHDAGIAVHVWVDETRPRNQGVLTAWELAQHGVPHTVIVDNAGGHLMQQRQVDLCIVGTDRTTRNGDVANKIGTYLKALAAHDNGIPFYAAVPSSSIDFSVGEPHEIPIEERPGDEVRKVLGARIFGRETAVANPAFDVTPRRLMTGLITERGIADPNSSSLAALFPERVR